jgi:hypothetical protein
MTIKLTSAQRKFLRLYLCELPAEVPNEEKSNFIKFVSAQNYDGPASYGQCLIARNLQIKGLLSECVPHGMIGTDYLLVKFNTAGAEAIWFVHNH